MNGMKACALAGWLLMAAPAGAVEVVHVPSDDMRENQREVLALKKELDAGGSFAFFLEKPELSVGQSRHFIGIDWKEDGFVTRTVQGSRPSMEFKYEALPKIEVIHDTVWGGSFYGVRVSDDWAIWCQAQSPSVRLVCGKWLGETLSFFRLRHAAVVRGRAAFEARFREALAKYPDPAGRPELPEEARRFMVQAEAAFRDRRIQDALNLYTQGAAVAPWWAEGFFNIALLAAELKQHDMAIRNMKRYLLLLPDAANAREAQDKVYEWESLRR